MGALTPVIMGPSGDYIIPDAAALLSVRGTEGTLGGIVEGDGPPSGRPTESPVYRDRLTGSVYGYRTGTWYGPLNMDAPPPALVQFVTAPLKGSGTLTLPQAPTEGNKLILVDAIRDSSPGLPTSVGFVDAHYVDGWPSGGAGIAIQYRDVEAGDAAGRAVAANNHDSRICIMEWSGLALGGPTDVGQASGSSTGYSGGVVTAGPVGLVVGVIAARADALSGVGADAGYAMLGEGIAFESVAPFGVPLYRIIDVEGAGDYAPGAASGTFCGWTGGSAFWPGFA